MGLTRRQRRILRDAARAAAEVGAGAALLSLTLGIGLAQWTYHAVRMAREEVGR